jgi:hypothetical protein
MEVNIPQLNPRLNLKGDTLLTRIEQFKAALMKWRISSSLCFLIVMTTFLP